MNKWKKEMSKIVMKLENSQNKNANRVSRLLTANVGKELFDPFSEAWTGSTLFEKVEMLKSVRNEGITIEELLLIFKEMHRAEPIVLNSVPIALVKLLEHSVILSSF